MSTIEIKDKSPKRKKSRLPSSDILLAGFYAFLIAAFVYIVALAWNNAINASIDYYFKDRRSVWFKIVYAFIITFIAIILIYYAAKFSHQTLRFTA